MLNCSIFEPLTVFRGNVGKSSFIQLYGKQYGNVASTTRRLPKSCTALMPGIPIRVLCIQCPAPVSGEKEFIIKRIQIHNFPLSK